MPKAIHLFSKDNLEATIEMMTTRATVALELKENGVAYTDEYKPYDNMTLLEYARRLTRAKIPFNHVAMSALAKVLKLRIILWVENMIPTEYTAEKPESTVWLMITPLKGSDRKEQNRHASYIRGKPSAVTVTKLTANIKPARDFSMLLGGRVARSTGDNTPATSVSQLLRAAEKKHVKKVATTPMRILSPAPVVTAVGPDGQEHVCRTWKRKHEFHGKAVPLIADIYKSVAISRNQKAAKYVC